VVGRGTPALCAAEIEDGEYIWGRRCYNCVFSWHMLLWRLVCGKSIIQIKQ
jgi:hypothetical protein